jgi:hypothetical protein
MIAGRLVPHPDSPATSVDELTVMAERLAPELLFLRFTLIGDLAELRIPPATHGERRDELWRHSCFEAFLGGEGPAYFEINLAPAGDWAAYRFGEYRQGMTPAPLAPKIDVRREPRRIELRAAISILDTPELPGDTSWRLGASAVIEDQAGELGYWALAHPPGAPDFHKRDCFALALPPAQPR